MSWQELKSDDLLKTLQKGFKYIENEKSRIYPYRLDLIEESPELQCRLSYANAKTQQQNKKHSANGIGVSCNFFI